MEIKKKKAELQSTAVGEDLRILYLIIAIYICVIK